MSVSLRRQRSPSVVSTLERQYSQPFVNDGYAMGGGALGRSSSSSSSYASPLFARTGSLALMRTASAAASPLARSSSSWSYRSAFAPSPRPGYAYIYATEPQAQAQDAAYLPGEQERRRHHEEHARRQEEGERRRRDELEEWRQRDLARRQRRDEQCAQLAGSLHSAALGLAVGEPVVDASLAGRGCREGWLMKKGETRHNWYARRTAQKHDA